MKLHSISLQNFKSFKGETAIPLGRITYLIGPNGAGKSNVLHGLKTLSAIITKDDYAPEPGDYFDSDTDQEMKLAAVLELSDVERQTIGARIRTRPLSVSHGDLGDWLFKRLKYETTFIGSSKAHAVSFTFTDEKYHIFINIEHANNRQTAKFRSVETINMADKSLPDLEPHETTQSTTVHTLLGEIGKYLASQINVLFSGVAYTTTQRGIPKSTSVHESSGITPDGSNILNELHDLTREKQLKFDKFLSTITNKSLNSVETRMRGSEMELEAREPDLSRGTPHKDLGSGHSQLVLLSLPLFVRPGTIFMLAEPELQLHPRAQKRLRAEIKKASAELQIVVETHSPIFLGTDQGETTLLITKDQGSSHATPIFSDNMDVIRHELGITHYDALYHTSILFVEGYSEHAAFPRFLTTLGYNHASRTSVFNLKGVGRLKHLRPLLQHFGDDDRKTFVILDRNDTAQSTIEALKRDGLLDDNYRILERDFEDAFTTKTIIDAVTTMARQFDLKFGLTAAELDRLRGEGKPVAAVLREHWKKSTDHDFNKVDLAKSLASLPLRDIPDEIKGALQTAMAHFGEKGGGAHAHEQYPATSRALVTDEHSRTAAKPLGSSPRSPSPQRPLGDAARGLLERRNILSADSDDFAENEHFSRLHSPVWIDKEKPAVLFTACPHDLGNNVDVTAPEFAVWVETTASVKVDGRQVRVPGLDLYVDIGRLLAVDQSPRPAHRRDVLAYKEFQSNGLFEYGTSQVFLYRNEKGKMEIHLCYMVGEFWSFLAQARLFYQWAGLDAPFTAFLSIKNSDRFRLGNYGDEALHSSSPRGVRFDTHAPSTHRRNISLRYAFDSARGATDEEIARAARDAAKQVCSAYGDPVPRCYGKDGSFSWRLWNVATRNAPRGGRR